MQLLFEIGIPLLWLYFGFRLWQADRWQAWLYGAFYCVCLFCEAVAIRFGEYYYGHMWLEICPPGPLWRAASTCPQPDLCLPLAVPCMEGALFFAGWVWATRRENAPWLRPLAGAVLAVFADLILDPVAARGEMCGATSQSWGGIGLWTWLLDPADPGHYFGIPVDNALAWLASCTGFGYAAIWLPGKLSKDPQRLGFVGRLILAVQVSLLGLVLAGVIFALLDVVVTPPATTEVYRVPALFILVGGGMVWLLARAFKNKAAGPATTTDRAASWVMALHLAYVLLALLLGYDEPALVPLWLLVAAGLALYAASARWRSNWSASTRNQV